MTFGSLLVGLGLFWLSRVGADAGYMSSVLGPLLVIAIGLGQIFVSTSVVAISGINSNESGLASALLNVGRQLGGSLGIAVMGTIAATVTRDHLATGRVTRAALNQAVTVGYSAAFVVAALIMLAGLITAVVAVQGRPKTKAAEAVIEAA
jgi:hypothetical protein